MNGTHELKAYLQTRVITGKITNFKGIETSFLP